MGRLFLSSGPPRAPGVPPIDRTGTGDIIIKTSRSVQNDAVVASERHFEVGKSFWTALTRGFPCYSIQRGISSVRGLPGSSDIQSDAPSRLLHHLGHFWMLLMAPVSRLTRYWRSLVPKRVQSKNNQPTRKITIFSENPLIIPP